MQHQLLIYYRGKKNSARFRKTDFNITETEPLKQSITPKRETHNIKGRIIIDNSVFTFFRRFFSNK